MAKKKICQKCGKKFIPERSDQRFCQNCKNKVIKTKCTICNKTFILSKYQKRYWLEGKEDFYCSYACAKKVDKHQKYKKNCDKCKQEYYPKRKDQRFCDECINRSVMVKCSTCGKEFTLTDGTKKRWLNGETEFYCSNACVGASIYVIEKRDRTKEEKYGNKTYNNRDKAKKTVKEKYNVDNVMQLDWVQDKLKQRYLEEFGVEYLFQTEEFKQRAKKTLLEKYNCEHPAQNKDIINKIHKTNLDRYHVKTPMQNPKFARKQFLSAVNTRVLNNNRSKEELYFEEMLNFLGFKKDKDYFIEWDQDPRYPFFCDFYIPAKDLFIELNCYYMHGGHWYNSKSNKDKAIIQKWKKKQNKHKQYKIAIDIWTVRDVKKKNIAKRNNLNYVVLWNKEDIDNWFDLKMPIGKDWKREYSWK